GRAQPRHPLREAAQSADPPPKEGARLGRPLPSARSRDAARGPKRARLCARELQEARGGAARRPDARSVLVGDLVLRLGASRAHPSPGPGGRATDTSTGDLAPPRRMDPPRSARPEPRARMRVAFRARSE